MPPMYGLNEVLFIVVPKANDCERELYEHKTFVLFYT